MSDTDPYAAPVTATTVAPAVPAQPEAVEAPVTEEIVVPEGSIKTVLAWVGDDATRAQKALDAEHEGEKRTSLISKLESIIN